MKVQDQAANSINNEFVAFLINILQPENEQDFENKLQELGQEEIDNLYKEFLSKTKRMEKGGKIDFLKDLRGQCPEGMEIFMSGGCVKCRDKNKNIRFKDELSIGDTNSSGKAKLNKNQLENIQRFEDGGENKKQYFLGEILGYGNGKYNRDRFVSTKDSKQLYYNKGNLYYYNDGNKEYIDENKIYDYVNPNYYNNMADPRNFKLTPMPQIIETPERDEIQSIKNIVFNKDLDELKNFEGVKADQNLIDAFGIIMDAKNRFSESKENQSNTKESKINSNHNNKQNNNMQNMSFNQAFATAHKAGLKEFEWNGKKYAVKFAESKENKNAKKEATPVMMVRKIEETPEQIVVSTTTTPLQLQSIRNTNNSNRLIDKRARLLDRIMKINRKLRFN